MAISSGQTTIEVLSTTVLPQSRCLPDFQGQPGFRLWVRGAKVHLDGSVSSVRDSPRTGGTHHTVTKPVKGHRAV